MKNSDINLEYKVGQKIKSGCYTTYAMTEQTVVEIVNYCTIRTLCPCCNIKYEWLVPINE